MAPSKSAKEGSKLQAIYRDARQKRHPEREEVLGRGCEISRNDQVGSEFTKQLGTRRRRAQKTPLVPPVQAGFYFEDGRSPLGVAMLSPEKCRDRAAECLQWAESAPSSRVRDILLDVARIWTRLAIEAESSNCLAKVALIEPKMAEGSKKFRRLPGGGTASRTGVQTLVGRFVRGAGSNFQSANSWWHAVAGKESTSLSVLTDLLVWPCELPVLVRNSGGACDPEGCRRLAPAMAGLFLWPRAVQPTARRRTQLRRLQGSRCIRLDIREPKWPGALFWALPLQQTRKAAR